MFSIGAAPAFAGVTISSPSNGETVSSPFTLSADASSCSSQPTSSIGYSLDNNPDTTVVNETTVNIKISASAGTHTLHVKTWGDKGAACDTDVSIKVENVTDDVVADTSVVPSNAVSVSGIPVMGGWRAQHDSGTPGSSTGKMSLVSSPSHSGAARKFATTYRDGGGERYSVSFSDNRSSTSFLYDAWVYFASPSTHIANLELDLYQTMENGQTVLFGFQCDGYSGTWDVSENLGTASHPRGHWAHTSKACNPRKWATDKWHHVQIEYSRTTTGKIDYQAVWLDGVKSAIGITAFAARDLGWGSTLLTNFQIDGLGSSGSATVYLGGLTIYHW